MRELDVRGEFDAAICLCQGGFGLLGGHDEADVFGRIAAHAPTRRSRWRVSAFSAAFAVRHLEAGEDVRPGDRRAARGGHGPRPRRRPKRAFDLWTTCFTARELELLARGAGLDVDRGARRHARARTARQPPTLDHPELLLLARRR